MADVFPAKISLNKPTDYKLSAAMERMYDVWNPHEDAGNEFYSNFKYTWLEGFSRQPNGSRRDPSKVLRIEVGVTSLYRSATLWVPERDRYDSVCGLGSSRGLVCS